MTKDISPLGLGIQPVCGLKALGRYSTGQAPGRQPRMPAVHTSSGLLEVPRELQTELRYITGVCIITIRGGEPLEYR